MESTNKGWVNEVMPWIAWVTALLALVGSLFFSEVLAWPPCLLCWWQRVAMYPLVVIIAAGLIMGDPKMKVYSLLLAVAGLGIAVYHNLLYYGIIPENIQPCSEGLSCTERQLELWGFVTIPLLSLLSFVVVIGCLALYKPGKRNAD